MTTKTKKMGSANILSPDDVQNTARPLPEAWKKAAGLLQGKLPDGVRYQKKVRAEWEARLKKLEKISHGV